MMNTTLLLEENEGALPMEERILRGASRMTDMLEGSDCPYPERLRKDQGNVFLDFSAYLQEIATSPAAITAQQLMGRIILPPRTGKTVVAAHLISTTRLTATFIVPKRSLVDQVAQELRSWLPGVPIGQYCTEAKDLVEYGVNVVTYDILQARWREENMLPPVIARSAFVFSDEAHRSMTSLRQHVLANGFDPKALRIALTATPDYSDDRQLRSYYPVLIHEITLPEAVELELTAPMRMWVYEVDEDASTVQIVAGDFQETQISELMSHAPFFEAARAFRYAPQRRANGALMCCRTRQQARDLEEYLKTHRPIGTPAPGVILGQTCRRARLDMLAAFEAREIDTLIGVGVLTEGWDSPVCKVLVDLAPSVSLVRATQKFFRPMTKDGDKEAHIGIILPKGLRYKPILPTDLILPSGSEYEIGDLVDPRTRNACNSLQRLIQAHDGSVIEKVTVQSRVLVTARFERPRLNPENDWQIRQVLKSNPAVFEGTRVTGYLSFRHLVFRHDLFTGRGEQLLRYLGVEMSREQYVNFMAKFFHEAALEQYANIRYSAWDQGEYPVLIRSFQDKRAHSDDAMDYRQGDGDLYLPVVHRDMIEDVETRVDLDRAIERLGHRHQPVVRLFHGMGKVRRWERPHPSTQFVDLEGVYSGVEIAEFLDNAVGRGGVNQRLRKAYRALRHRLSLRRGTDSGGEEYY